MQRRYLIPVLIVLIVLAAVWNLKRNIEQAEAPPMADIGGAFSLVDHNAKPVTDKDYLGRHLLIFFGYTYCPDICPLALETVSAVQDILGKDSAKLHPLFISVDSERDTPDVLKDYLGNFHPSITGLTGSPDQVRNTAKVYRIFFAKVREEGDPEDEYLMNHSTALVLMNPKGKFLRVYNPNIEAEALAADIEKRL